MNLRIQLTAFILSFVLLNPLLTLAQRRNTPVPPEWTAVRAVPSEEQLIIQLKGGKTIKGNFASASDTSLSVIHKGQPINVEREQIASVHRVVRRSAKGKYSLIGTGIGAAVGLVIGQTKVSERVDDSEIYRPFGATVGASIGALVGLAIGAGRRKRILIYEAP